MPGHSPSEVIIPTLVTLVALIIGKVVDNLFERRRQERLNHDGVVSEQRRDKKDRTQWLEKKTEEWREKYYDERERRMRAETKSVLLEMRLSEAMTVLDRREPASRPVPPQLTDTVPPHHGSS